MPRKLCLRLCAFLVLTTFVSTANACCLLPFLNPFAWMFGCGYGYNPAGYYGSYQPYCGTGWGHGDYGRGGYGHGGYGHGHATNYPGWTGNIYTPAWSAPAGNCDCNPTVVPQTAVPSAALPGSSFTAWSPVRSWPGYSAWQPQQYAAGPSMAWQPQSGWPTLASPVAQTTPRAASMNTAPMYGPVWSVPSTTAPGVTAAAGDHEYSVIPNSFQGPIPIRPASFQATSAGYGIRPRAPHRYTQTVR